MASPSREAAAAGAAEQADHLPRRFGRYLLFDRIGRGGMADIYLARVETELGVARRVVVKQILPELVRDAHFARMLVDEAKLVSDLRHANIAQVLDLGREGERLFIAMEYVEGFDLNQLLRALTQRRIALPAEFALFLVREVLASLDFAHRATGDGGRPLGIVHRDVSPSNVLVSFEGEVKLCDFGIAKALGAPAVTAPSEPRSTEEGSGERSRIAGKAAYMSPEHARGEELDARADIFSAGIVLWELCAGRRLYRGSEAEMLELARAGVVPPLPDRGLPAQPELQAILDRALAPDPGARWQTAAEMGRALDAYAMGAKLFASQLRFASFLSDHFEADVVRLRRARERAAEALELGPPAVIAPVTPPEEPPAPGAEVTDAQRELAAVDTRRLRASTAALPRRRAPLVIAAGGVALLVLLAALAALALR